MVEGKPVDLFRCPTREIAPAAARVLPYYQWLESGSWPVSGGVGDQCATFVAMAEIVGAAMGRIMSDRMKKEERESASVPTGTGRGDGRR